MPERRQEACHHRCSMTQRIGVSCASGFEEETTWRPFELIETSKKGKSGGKVSLIKYELLTKGTSSSDMSQSWSFGTA